MACSPISRAICVLTKRDEDDEDLHRFHAIINKKIVY